MEINLEVRRQFKNSLYIADRQAYNKWAIYTQAWLESGGFAMNNILVPAFNLWGITVKYDRDGKPDWHGQIVRKQTFEIINGQRVDLFREFKGFPSAYAAITFYCNKIRHMYPNSYDNRHDAMLFFEGLMNGVNQWSTSPDYSQKLVELYTDLRSRGEFNVDDV